MLRDNSYGLVTTYYRCLDSSPYSSTTDVLSTLNKSYRLLDSF
jgi:hypothetical protein